MEQYPRKNRYKAGPGRPKTVDPNEYYRYNANFPIELYEHLKASAFNASTPEHHVSVQEYLNNLIYTDMIQNGKAVPKKTRAKPKKKQAKEEPEEEPDPEPEPEEDSSEEPDQVEEPEPIVPEEEKKSHKIPREEIDAWMEKKIAENKAKREKEEEPDAWDAIDAWTDDQLKKEEADENDAGEDGSKSYKSAVKWKK